MAVKIYDQAGAEMIYWPVQLDEGETSAVLVVGIDTPAQGHYLTVTDDVKVRVEARLHGTSNPFVDIANTPVDLSTLPSGVTQFDVRIKALAPLLGQERHALIASAATIGPADWAS